MPHRNNIFAFPSMNNTTVQMQTIDQSLTAMERYNEALNLGWDTTRAMQYAAVTCTTPAELDKLQVLINKQFISELYAKLRSEVEAVEL